MCQALLVTAPGRHRENRGGLPRLLEGKAGLRRSLPGLQGALRLRQRGAERAGRRDGGDRGLDSGEGQLQRGLRRRARDRPPVSAEERAPAVSDGRLLPRLGRHQRGQVQPLGVRRLHSEERPGVDGSDLQEHVRETGRAEERHSREDRLMARPHERVVKGPRPFARLSGDAEGHRPRESGVPGPELGQRSRADSSGGRGPLQDGDPGIGRHGVQEGFPRGRPDQLCKPREDPGADAERPVRPLLSDRVVAAAPLPPPWNARERQAARYLRERPRSSPQGVHSGEPRLAGQVSRTGEEIDRSAHTHFCLEAPGIVGHSRTILITGAAGNLGSLLARRLIPRGQPLRLMYHRRPLPDDIVQAPNVTPVQADLDHPRTLSTAVNGADVVVHFAGVLFAPQPEHFLPETAIFNPGVRGIYHVADEQPVTLQHFLDEACRVWGYARPVRLPLWVIYTAPTLCEWLAMIVRRPSPLTRDFIRIGRVSHWGDTRRAREELIPKLEYPTLTAGLSTL